jgi:hypothetical protein
MYRGTPDWKQSGVFLLVQNSKFKGSKKKDAGAAL